MKRVLLLTLGLGLVCAGGFAQQQSSSDQNSNSQNSSGQQAGDSKPQKTAEQKSNTKTKASDSSSSGTQDNRPASERFPFPGDQTGQPTGAQSGSQANSGNSLPNSPDDNRPASERFPFPGDQSNQQTNDNRPAAAKFPFPGDAPTAPPHSDPRGPNDSSSKDRNVDISPPPDDYKHDGSDLIGPEPAPGVVEEMKPWNPHQADKDVEVGMFYFKEKNYTAAESRFREALYWQDNHAEALYRLGTALEKQGKNPEAKHYYEQYLKILPNGDLAKDARKGLARVGGEASSKADSKTPIARP